MSYKHQEESGKTHHNSITQPPQRFFQKHFLICPQIMPKRCQGHLLLFIYVNRDKQEIRPTTSKIMRAHVLNPSKSNSLFLYSLIQAGTFYTFVCLESHKTW